MPLARQCEQGRLYEVEEWIRQGLPLHLAPGVEVHSAVRSPLQIALRTGQHSLVLLLLRHGCAPDADRSSPYNIALQIRRPDLVDLTRGHALAAALAYHPNNKPLFGFVKHRRERSVAYQTELSIALAYHADRGRNAVVLDLVRLFARVLPSDDGSP